MHTVGVKVNLITRKYTYLRKTSLVPRLSWNANIYRVHNFNFAFRSVGAWERGYVKTASKFENRGPLAWYSVSGSVMGRGWLSPRGGRDHNGGERRATCTEWAASEVCVSPHPRQPDWVGTLCGARAVQGHALPAFLQRWPSRQGQSSRSSYPLVSCFL